MKGRLTVTKVSGQNGADGGDRDKTGSNSSLDKCQESNAAFLALTRIVCHATGPRNTQCPAPEFIPVCVGVLLILSATCIAMNARRSHVYHTSSGDFQHDLYKYGWPFSMLSLVFTVETRHPDHIVSFPKTKRPPLKFVWSSPGGHFAMGNTLAVGRFLLNLLCWAVPTTCLWSIASRIQRSQSM